MYKIQDYRSKYRTGNKENDGRESHRAMRGNQRTHGDVQSNHEYTKYKITGVNTDQEIRRMMVESPTEP